MGLDVVEIVLRAEEFFAIEICDDEAEAVRTVGDFYNLICRKLEVPALQSPLTSEALPTISEEEKTLVFLYRSTLLRPPPEVLPWSSQSVWDCLVAVLVDQQGLRVEETMYTRASSKTLVWIEIWKAVRLAIEANKALDHSGPS